MSDPRARPHNGPLEERVTLPPRDERHTQAAMVIFIGGSSSFTLGDLYTSGASSESRTRTSRLGRPAPDHRAVLAKCSSKGAERVRGIEPPPSRWQRDARPSSYTRKICRSGDRSGRAHGRSMRGAPAGVLTPEGMSCCIASLRSGPLPIAVAPPVSCGPFEPADCRGPANQVWCPRSC